MDQEGIAAPCDPDRIVALARLVRAAAMVGAEVDRLVELALNSALVVATAIAMDSDAPTGDHSEDVKHRALGRPRLEIALEQLVGEIHGP